MRRLLLVALSAASLGVWLSVATSNGDAWNVWTDHLRHEGEAIALAAHGPRLFTLTYDEATQALTLPCREHYELWGKSGIPYPPLGVLVHWPIARLELAGVVSPRPRTACWSGSSASPASPRSRWACGA